MKVKFYCDSGANIHSRREETFDLEKDLGVTPEEWEEMAEVQRTEYVKDWMNEYLEYGWSTDDE